MKLINRQSELDRLRVKIGKLTTELATPTLSARLRNKKTATLRQIQQSISKLESHPGCK